VGAGWGDPVRGTRWSRGREGSGSRRGVTPQPPAPPCPSWQDTAVADLKASFSSWGALQGGYLLPPKQQALTRVLQVIYSPREKSSHCDRRGGKKRKNKRSFFSRIQMWQKRLRIFGNKFVARHNISILQRQWQ